MLPPRPEAPASRGPALSRAALTIKGREADRPDRDRQERKGQIMCSSTDTADARNVLGGDLAVCCTSPMTGFYRTGRCETGPEDHGVHTVCAEVTEDFLAYSKSRGNDLTTPRPQFAFPGLKPGDRWCLCAARWQEALSAGCAPNVILASTHEATLRVVDLADLKRHALDLV